MVTTPRNADTLGGWQIMVSNLLPEPGCGHRLRAIPDLERDAEVTRRRASRLPTIVDLYDDADVLEANPFFAQTEGVFLGGAVARPSTVTSDLYNEVSTAYFTAVNEILTGQASDAAGPRGACWRRTRRDRRRAVDGLGSPSDARRRTFSAGACQTGDQR